MTTSRKPVVPIPNPDRNKVKTLEDLALAEITLDDFPQVKAWREKLFSDDGLPEICDELPRLLTEAMRDSEEEGYTMPRRARVLKHVFSHKTPKVAASDLMPGGTTTSFVGPVVYMDTIGYCIWPELKTVASRAQNPFRIKEETAERLNREIFPYWMERRAVQEVARYSAYDSGQPAFAAVDPVEGGGVDPPLSKRAGETPKCQELMERVYFYLSDKATAVSHTVPDFSRVLAHGLDGLSEHIQFDMAGLGGQGEKDFAAAVLTVFDGVKAYAERLAQEAERNGNGALAAVCRRVPAQPARSLHEALACIWICYHSLLQENTNFGLSLGRLDQLTNAYYLADWGKLTSDAEKAAYRKRAVEMVCHFFLRCSDHVPLSTEGSETLFAGSGSNQALTVGGTLYRDGQVVDGVNDMTYIVLKATELLAIRDPNVHARYHVGVNDRDEQGQPYPGDQADPYLRRICQVNLLTRATPAIHGDQAVVAAMAPYYAAHQGVSQDEALADAHDYASIGCIEQNAAGKHFGHTGSTLMVLPAVLELALFGGKHRSDGVGPEDGNLFDPSVRAFTTPPLTAMTSMDQFIDAFRVQLDALAREAVRNNNYLGRFLAQVRPSPLLSGLFDGPTNAPGQTGASFTDVSQGGAKYDSAGVAIIGLADVIDAFCVIHALVFGGKMTAQELLSAMEADFDPDKAQNRTRMAEINAMIKRAPKYGAGVEVAGECDNSLALTYTRLLTGMIHETFFRYRTHRGGRYLAGYWSMTNHAGFGMLTKATPNGRKSGHAFAGGITPCPGIVKPNGDGVTLLDHMLSVAHVEPVKVQNGYTYNLSLTPGGAADMARDTRRFADYIKTFLQKDGVLVQLCVSSIDDLKEAHAAATQAESAGANERRQLLQPYKDFMIRVAGYSAYFVTLSPQMREEIIARANFDLVQGREQHRLGG